MIRTRTHILSLFLTVAAVGAAPHGANAQQSPRLNKDEALQLFAEAGFRIEAGRTVNRCGGASNPRVAFADLNGDGRAEAHVADVDPKCYGKPGAYFAILSRDANGRWHRMIAEDGIVGFEKTRTGGWTDLRLDAANSACPGPRRFAGSAYPASAACNPFALKTEKTSSPPNAAPGPVSQKKAFDWDGEQTAEARALPITERNAIFKAAGVRQVKGGKWTGCTEDPTGGSEAMVVLVRDINGDGRPEAVIYDSGSYCSGMAGVHSTLLSKNAAGSWTVMMFSQGFIGFTASRGTGHYPDIELGLPGFCFPYFRWNGTEYALAARLDDKGKPCRPG